MRGGAISGKTRRTAGTTAATTTVRTTGPGVLSGVVLLCTLLLWLLWPSPALAQASDVGGFVEGEVVVKLQPDATLEQVYAEHRTIDVGGTEALLNSSRIYLLQLEPGADAGEVAREMRGDTSSFIYAEPNYTVDSPEGDPRSRARSDYLPEPTTDAASYRDQYAVDAMRSVCARDTSDGSNTTVAVLDTGVQTDHPALAGSLVPGYDFVDDDANPSEEANGVDEDGDAYIDSTGTTQNVDEMVGHGTHVAGIVHLVAPQADIMPLRVLDSDGIGNTFVIAEAIREAVDPDGDPNTPDGVDVINMSLGSSQQSRLLRDVTEDLAARDDDDDDDDDGDGDPEGPVFDPVSVPVEGVVVVASAGNEGGSERRYPAAEDDAIAVASVGEDEERSEFSNFGDWVDVSAPGDDIYSAFTRDALGVQRYAQWDGTSMSAPFVAGQAALIRGLEPDIPATRTPGESSPVPADGRSVESVIEETARPLGPSLGAGHADAFAAVRQLRPDDGSTCERPEISGLRPALGSRVRDRSPEIEARVIDRETDLAAPNLGVTLDGADVLDFEYDAGLLTFSANRLSRGQHTVVLTAEDADGLEATRSWSFKVTRR